MDWVNVNQDRDKWQAVYFHKVQGISWLAEVLLASEGRLCTMEWAS
jgi:hypothetical protein